ncbi:MAG TPA: 2'-5' RNA ligase family protein [Dermatophilaceae bacterium]|nr:2'-5' RNA ligase family protein [Dermatophilaceae bacterium]
MSLIGVSIAIPEPYAAQLQDRRASYGDPLAASIPTHVTLLPPTEVAPGGLARVAGHLRRVASGHRPFSMRLAGTGTFRPVSPVVFVQITEGAVECAKLQDDVRSGPLDRELDFEYHPHVTVAHDVSEQAMDQAMAELADYACTFDVDGFHLYEHGPDAVWRTVEKFLFRPVSRGEVGR